MDDRRFYIEFIIDDSRKISTRICTKYAVDLFTRGFKKLTSTESNSTSKRTTVHRKVSVKKKNLIQINLKTNLIDIIGFYIKCMEHTIAVCANIFSKYLKFIMSYNKFKKISQQPINYRTMTKCTFVNNNNNFFLVKIYFFLFLWKRESIWISNGNSFKTVNVNVNVL